MFTLRVCVSRSPCAPFCVRACEWITCYQLKLCIKESLILLSPSSGDNRITYDEYRAYCHKYPRMLKPMTLPLLGQLTSVYPSFVNNSFVLDDREKLQLHGGLTEEMAEEDGKRRSATSSRRPSRAGSRRHSSVDVERRDGGRRTSGDGEEGGARRSGKGSRTSSVSTQQKGGVSPDVLREKIEEVAEEEEKEATSHYL